MSDAAAEVTLSGEFARGVLGTFRIIRGFASLPTLAEISEPFEMGSVGAASGAIQGHQRSIQPQHAEEIKRYLQAGKLRFFPEIIISIRAEFRDVLDAQQRTIGVISDTTPGLWIGRRYKSRTIPTHQLSIRRSDLPQLKRERRIRRIDGNHRLHFAGQLQPDDTIPTKYLAPFCAVLLGPPGDANDDYVEAMLFETINSTAVPLDSEHALRLILGQAQGLRPTAAEEFAESPVMYLTRMLREKLDRLPEAQRQRLGTTPVSVIHATAKAMIEGNKTLAQSRQATDAFAEDLYGALTEILARLPGDCPEFCKAGFFVELSGLVWNDTGTGAHDQRMQRTIDALLQMARWLGNDGLHRLDGRRSMAAQLYEVFRAIRTRVPKRVFLARWYPTDADGADKTRADYRLNELRRTAASLNLELIDMGTRLGGTYQIPPAMYDAISSSDIILADLTGFRPNVMIEIGFALRHHDKGRLLLYFETTGGARAPFDLASFQYVPIDQAAEIPVKLKPHLEAILAKAKAGTI